MKKITEIRIHGRGGQGSVTAAELIACAGFYDGMHVQAFPIFGVERRGAPLSAFVRLGSVFIRDREQVYSPDYLIIQDPTLIKTTPELFVGERGFKAILINSEHGEWPQFKYGKVYAVPATKIALEKIGKPFINTVLLGAFAAVSETITKKALAQAIDERFEPEVAKSNIAAMSAAYEYIKKNYQS